MDMNMQTEYVLVTTVKENKEKYTSRDIGNVIVARKMHQVIGNQSALDLVILSVYSHIKNCTVTAADTKLAEKIDGPHIAGVEGKSV